MAKKYLDENGLLYLWSKIKAALTGKQDNISDIETIRAGAAKGETAVQSVTGKGLSTEDYTTEEKDKLNNIAAEATRNEPGDITPKPNGTAAVGIDPGFARCDHVHPTDTTRAPLSSPTFTGIPAAPTAEPGTDTTQIATTAFVKRAVEAAVNGAVGAVYRMKGTKNSYADLPSNPSVGDVWNVVAAHGNHPAGTNYVCTEDGEWDALGGAIDLSGYAQKSDLSEISNAEIDAICE